jgi:hypothetical protein
MPRPFVARVLEGSQIAIGTQYRPHVTSHKQGTPRWIGDRRVGAGDGEREGADGA